MEVVVQELCTDDMVIADVKDSVIDEAVKVVEVMVIDVATVVMLELLTVEVLWIARPVAG